MGSVTIRHWNRGLNVLSQPMAKDHDFLEQMTNLIETTRNALQKVPGSDKLNSVQMPWKSAISSIYGWEKSDSGAIKHLFNSGSIIGEIHLGSGVWCPIATGCTRGKRFSYASANNTVYMGNGAQMVKYYGLTKYRNEDVAWVALNASSTSRLAQSFQITQNRRMATVGLKLKRTTSSPAGSVYVEIYTGASAPTTLVATSQAIPAASISTNPEWVPFSFVLSGTHTGANGAASLKTAINLVTQGAQVYDIVRNTTDGSWAAISAFSTGSSANDTAAGTLADGLQNDWDTGESYLIYIRPLLSKDTLYWVVLRSTGYTTGISWAVDQTAATYSLGQFATYSGSWTTLPTQDACFDVYVQPDNWGLKKPATIPKLTISGAPYQVAYETTANRDADKELNNVEGGNLGQSWKSEKSFQLGLVELYLKEIGTVTGNITVRIEEETAGRPSGTILGTSLAVDASGIGTSYKWVEFSFETLATSG